MTNHDDATEATRRHMDAWQRGDETHVGEDAEATGVFNRDPHTMSVCVDGDEPVACDFEARSVAEPHITWKIRFESRFFPDIGSVVDVEVRLIPGVVLVGKGVVTSVIAHPDAKDLPGPPADPKRPIWIAVVSGMGRLTDRLSWPPAR